MFTKNQKDYLKNNSEAQYIFHGKPDRFLFTSFPPQNAIYLAEDKDKEKEKGHRSYCSFPLFVPVPLCSPTMRLHCAAPHSPLGPHAAIKTRTHDCAYKNKSQIVAL